MKKRIFFIILSFVLMLSVMPIAKAIERPIEITITAHVEGNLESEIVAYMSDNGIADYSSIEGLTVSGGTINTTDRVFLYDKKIHQTLKAVDFSKTNIDFTAESGIPGDKRADAVNEIPSLAFGNWSAMTSIVLPDSVTCIGDFAFGGCNSLEKVYLPFSLKKLGYRAFYWSTRLKDVYTSSPVPPDMVESRAFENVDTNAVLHVSDGSGDAWDQKDWNKNGMLYQLRIENMAPILNCDIERTSVKTAQIQLSSSEPGCCYYALVKNNEKAPVIDTSGTGLAFDSTNRLIISLIDLVQGPYDLYIQAKDSIGNMGTAVKVDINAYVPYIDVRISNHETGKLLDEIDGILNSLDIPYEYDKIQSLTVLGQSFNDDDWGYLYCADRAQVIDLSGIAIEDLPYMAFSEFNMIKVILPSSLKSIDKYAFLKCKYLTSMIIQSPMPPSTYENAFYEVPKELVVYSPPGTWDAYKTADDGDTSDGLWYGIEVKEYSTVLIQTDGNGTASSDIAMGVNGQKVTLSASPRQGYLFKGWKVISPAALSIQENSFTLTEGQVIIKAVFEKVAAAADVPKTGDDSAPWILYVLCAASAAVIGFVLLRKRIVNRE